MSDRVTCPVPDCDFAADPDDDPMEAVSVHCLDDHHHEERGQL